MHVLSRKYVSMHVCSVYVWVPSRKCRFSFRCPQNMYLLDHTENLSKSSTTVYRNTLPDCNARKKAGNIYRGVSGSICIVSGDEIQGLLAQRAEALLSFEMAAEQAVIFPP